jgi:hypothetical protein
MKTMKENAMKTETQEKETYRGIDYSLGKSNVDLETGIHYGVLSQNDLSSFAWDDVYNHGEDVAFREALEEYLSANEGDEDELTQEFADSWESDISGYVYEREGLHLAFTETEVMVLKSPYVTYGQFCSPCFPGAVNLDVPMDKDNGVKAYCLPADWFDEYSPCPYQAIETV